MSAPASSPGTSPPRTSPSSTCPLAAADKALAASGLTADQLDVVLIATVTHLSQTPSAAAEVADRLGAGDPAAFDISAACAGFCYGLALAEDMVRGGSARHVLVVGVEKLSDMVDPTDRGTAFLFGDGAGAAVIGPSDTPGNRPGGLGLRRCADRGHHAGRLLDRAARRARPRLPAAEDERPAGVPLGGLRDGQGGPAGAGRRRGRPSTTSTCSSRTRPTCASPTR